MQSPIYLDHHATTPCDPRVIEAMEPYFARTFANPSSPHEAGSEAAGAVETAREQVAALLCGQAHEIVFTSGATESNNLAILGAARRHLKIGGTRRRLVTTAIEHKSVLGPMHYLGEEDWEVVVLPVDRNGIVDLEEAARVVNSQTLLVSLQAANQEIGTIQPVRDMAQLAHEQGALLHCDAAQACGKVLLDVAGWNIDLLSVSGHKLYGPKGIGALWLRGGPHCLPLESLCFGGSQEEGLRPGTLPVPSIVGIGAACDLCHTLLPTEIHRIKSLRDRLEEKLRSYLPNLSCNGALHNRLPGNSNITFTGIDAEAILANASGITVSTGSACESGTIEPSRVLTNIGLSNEESFSTLRLCIGRFTTPEEVDDAAHYIIGACRMLL
jgi:cysteine desulfurase